MPERFMRLILRIERNKRLNLLLALKRLKIIRKQKVAQIRIRPLNREKVEQSAVTSGEGFVVRQSSQKTLLQATPLSRLSQQVCTERFFWT